MTVTATVTDQGIQRTRRRPPDRPATITAVVPSYNVASLLERCLAALRQSDAELRTRGDRLDVVVVDNASRDGSADLVRQRFPRVTLVANPDNRGFGAACNQGAAGAGEFVLFLNPDAEVAPGALSGLLSTLRARPGAAIAGPRLVYPDGSPQPTRRRFPSLDVLLLESTPLEWRRPGWGALERYRLRGQPEVAGPVDWLSGACLLLRTAAFAAVGGFDPEFFMYFEEVDLARRLAARGWECWYQPAAVVVHHSSRSADQDIASRDRRYYTSKYRYVARYWGPAAAGAVRLTGGAAFGAELAIQALRRDPPLVRRYAALTRWHLTPGGA
ncbi:MAG TPA: glycosyltransferase family 2 protein [Chloroflexota bacterium]|nr:glycosyltransferase family 2 protein [Chloroflexota bacterium]